MILRRLGDFFSYLCYSIRYKRSFFVKDCGIPNRTGLDLGIIKREDAIGIHRRMHIACSELYFQIGSGGLIRQSNGKWKYDIVCEDKKGDSQHVNMKCGVIP